MENQYEIVHTMTDFYDGPRRGVADFNGLSVAYESTFTDMSEQKVDIFILQPIDDQTFQCALEGWQIWLRWEQAYKEGRTTADTHPALPEDKKRNEELDALLANELEIDEARAIRAEAEFKQINSRLYVKWIVIESEK